MVKTELKVFRLSTLIPSSVPPETGSLIPFFNQTNVRGMSPLETVHVRVFLSPATTESVEANSAILGGTVTYSYLLYSPARI